MFGKKNRPKILAIVGNGFDLNHGYQTGYDDFVKSVSDDNVDAFHTYCDKECIDTWYSFEENIGVLSMALFQQSYACDCNFEENRREVEKLKSVFEGIQKRLIEYLQEATQEPPVKKGSISRYLTDKAFAINFNYTNIVEAYTKNVFYVHGSLEENDILLGYDYRAEPCLAQYEDVRWSKKVCRECLMLRRYIRKKYGRDDTSDKAHRVLEGMEMYNRFGNSGRGIPEDARRIIPCYREIKRVVKMATKKNGIPAINYNHVETVVVIGHGIEADRMFLDHIMKACPKLKDAVLFVYDGESIGSVERKKAFLENYCPNITTIPY